MVFKLNRPGRSLLLATALSAVITLDAASTLAADLVTPEEIIVASTVPTTDRDAALDAARAFYDFWNTGDAALLKRAIADDFTDRTLPPGRPQGPEGPVLASRAFRGAVPDLTVTVHKMIVASPYVTVHMSFAGHFTGVFGTVRGDGQPVSFIAKGRPSSLLQRMIEPQEIANLVAYVASPLSAATNGAALRVDGGVTPTID
jgi:predicted ester cyclase